MESKRKNIYIVIFVITTIIASCVAVYFGVVGNNKKVGQIKNSVEEKIENETKEVNEKVSEENKLSKEEAKKIAQNIYNKAYNELEEGVGLQSSIVEITIGQEGTYGGKLNVKAYKLDFSKIEQYFTERAIKYIKTEYTDTPYGHSDGNYYIYMSENKYSHEKNNFVSTIFGVTDQKTRDLNVELYDDDIIIAVSQKSSFFELDEYLVLKKINSVWKIDMFESL